MRLRGSRALLGTTIAAALAAVGFAGPAHANTTLPGLNGKLAFTTNASTLSIFDELSAQRGTTQQQCYPPFSIFSIILGGGDALSCEAEINTINPDGTGQAAVTNDFSPDDAPAWSPQNGSRIAFQSSRGEDCTADATPLTCNYDIWSTAADGSSPTQVTSGPLDELHPSYSPDESKIAFDGLNPIFASTLPTPAAAGRDQVDPTLQQVDHLGQTIYTIPAGGGTATPLEPATETDPSQNGENLVSDSQAAWSPDGSQIAFTRLTISDLAAGSASTRLAVIPSVTISSGIYVAPASGGASHQVGASQQCDISGVGVPILLEAVNSGDLSAVNKALRGGTTQTTCTLDAEPAWSPDGSKLAFERITLATEVPEGASTRDFFNPFEDADVMVMNAADGSGVVDLSNVTEPADCQSFETLDSGFTCGLDQKPAWSPDGTKIAFFSNRNNSGVWPAEGCVDSEFSNSDCDDEIWVMNADGSSPTQVTNNDVQDINPDWQRIPPPPAPPVTPAAPTTPPKVGVAGVRRACVSKSFHLRFTVATTATSVKSVVVKLDGKRIKTTTKSQFTLTVNSKKLKAGRHRLTITATDSAGHVTTTHKSFSVCKAAKPRHKSAPRFTG